MSHVAFVPLTGIRVRSERVADLGMTLPGLQRRGRALEELPALGLLTLAGMLTEGWTCSYHEASRWDAELIEQIVSSGPTFAAISALTASIDDAYALSGALRARGIPVVLGGLHVTAEPYEASLHCDSVVVGEGEPVWHAILHDMQNGQLKRRYQADREFDLAQAPIPRFELACRRPISRFTLQTERGCPLACEFCAASRLLGRFREKPVAQIERELHALIQLSPRPVIELADDNTFVRRRDIDELFGVLGHIPIRYFTEVDWRIGEGPRLLAGLARSGCVQVLVGVESLVFRYPGMGGKQSDLERIVTAVAAIQAAGIAVNGCFIVGADGETRESLDRLATFLLESPFADACGHCLLVTIRAVCAVDLEAQRGN